MKALCIIPARKGSQRFPDKHHVQLLGKPMFSYTIEAALEAELLDRVVISSDDFKLKNLAEQYQIEFIERPPELATATSALDDAVRQVCRYLRDRDGFEPDTIVVMQGNVPVRKPGQLDDLLRRFETLPQATAICTSEEMRLRPEWAQVIKDQDTGETAPYMPGDMGFRFQDFPRIFSVDGSIHIVRWDTLFETEGNRAAHAWFGKRLHIHVQDHPMYSLEVDFPDEVPLAEYFLLYQRYGDRLHQKLVELEE